MRSFTRARRLLRRAERTLAARPAFADPAEFNAAMFAFDERGELPRDPRQAEFIRDYVRMLAAMDASVPNVGATA